MITSFFSLSKKFISMNKIRLSISIIGVALAVSLTTSIFSIFNSMERSYMQDIKTTYGEMDMMVGRNTSLNQSNQNSGTSVSNIQLGNKSQYKVKNNSGELRTASNKESFSKYEDSFYIQKEEIEKIKSLKDIKSTSNVLISSNILIGKSGRSGTKPFTVYAVGVENDGLAKSRYKFKKELKDDEVIINKSLAAVLGVKASDNVKIYIGGSSIKTCKIKEIVNNAQGAVSMDEAIFSIGTLQKWLNKDNEVSFMLIKKKKNVDSMNIVYQLRAFDKNLRIDVIELEDGIQKNLNQMKAIGYGLGALAIIVSALFIISNLRLFIYEYMKELAIMRSIGSKASQNFKIIFTQAGFIVTIGSVIGILLSFIGSTFFTNEFMKLYNVKITNNSFQWGNAIKISIISALFIMLFLIIPAIKSAKILPIQVIQENERLDFKKLKSRKRITLILLILGIVSLLIGRYSHNASGGDGVLGGLLGGLLIILSIFISLTSIIKQIFSFILPLFEFFGGRVAYVGIKNIISQVRQNSLIVFTIAGALMLSICSSSILNTVKGNDIKYIKDEYVCNLMITSRYDSGLSERDNILENIKKIAGVKYVITFSRPEGGIVAYNNSNNSTQDISFSGSSLKELMQKGLLPKSEDDTTNLIFLPKGYAKIFNLKDNDHITLVKNDPNYKGPGASLKVITVDKLPGAIGSSQGIVDWNNKELISQGTIIDKIAVDLKNINDSTIIKSLDELRLQYPELKWTNVKDAVNDSEQMLNQRYFLLFIVMAIILCIGIAGTITTLNSNMQAKRREFVILRAISITPKQLFKLVITQSFLYSIIGAFVGVISGIVILCSLSIGLRETVFIDWKVIIYMFFSMIIISSLFSIPMARRISKKSVIDELNSTAI